MSESGRRLTPTARKATVIVHIITSVGWLALMLCLLTLAVAALTATEADTVRSSYLAMRLLGDALIPPLSLLPLSSGVLLAVGTPWGLFKYRWVSTKLWQTLAAATASIFELAARLDEAARAVVGHPTGPVSAAAPRVHALQPGHHPDRGAAALHHKRRPVGGQTVGP